MPGVINNNTNWASFAGQFDPANRLQWQEYVGDDGKRTDTVTHGENLGTLQGWVLSHDWLLPALVYWLGVAYVDYSTPGNPILKRVLPAPHPETNNMFAKRIEIRGWKYKDRINAPNNQLNGRVPYARYEKYFLTIDFGSVDYDVLPDDQVTSEWQRFVSVDPEDDSEIISVPGGTYSYKNPGSSGFPDGLPTAAYKITKVLERTGLTIRAHNLPYDFIFDQYNIPRKLMKAKGRVNNDGDGAFLGFNNQTILLKGFKPRKFPASVPNNIWTVQQFGIDVDFFFGYQEPTKAISTETLAGWNLVPAIDPCMDGPWYGIQTSGGTPLYRSVRMLNLLTHWQINNVP